MRNRETIAREIRALEAEILVVETRVDELTASISEKHTHDNKVIDNLLALSPDELAGLLIRIPNLQEAIDARQTLKKVEKDLASKRARHTVLVDSLIALDSEDDEPRKGHKYFDNDTFEKYYDDDEKTNWYDVHDSLEEIIAKTWKNAIKKR